MTQTQERKLVQGQPGLAVQITAQQKNYIFKHGEVQTKKDYTLGGLYSLEEIKPPEAENKRSTETQTLENVWGENPTPAQRENFGNTLYVLPKLLEKLGAKLLDDKLQNFHQAVKKVKSALSKDQINGIISLDSMRKAEEYMKQYNVSGYIVKVTAIRVDTKSFAGSRKRNDGLFEARKTVRTVLVDRMLSSLELMKLAKFLADSIAKPIIDEIQISAGFTMDRTKHGTISFTPVIEKIAKNEGEVVQTTSQRRVPNGIKQTSSSGAIGESRSFPSSY